MHGTSSRLAPPSTSIVEQLVKLRATQRVPRQPALQAGYQPAGPRGYPFHPAPQRTYASLAASALRLRSSAQRFFCALEMRLRAASLRVRLTLAGFAAACEETVLPFSMACISPIFSLIRCFSTS